MFDGVDGVGMAWYVSEKFGEQAVRDLGYENSVRRRYLRFDEIPAEELLWKTKAPVDERGRMIYSSPLNNRLAKSSEEFARVVLRGTDKPIHCDWHYFKKRILPLATTMEAYVRDAEHMAALVAPACPEAANPVAWDNGVTWYYQDGSRPYFRVEDCGRSVREEEIYCRLMWNNGNGGGCYATDLDFICETPAGEYIYHSVPEDTTGGSHSGDANAHGYRSMDNPEESIFWLSGAPHGHYRFLVESYVKVSPPCEYTVELCVGGKRWLMHDRMLDFQEDKLALEFDYYGRDAEKLVFGERGDPAYWNIESKSFVPVRGISTSPNIWGDNEAQLSDRHVFFLLDGCYDTCCGIGHGLPRDMLGDELAGVKNTVAPYLGSLSVEGGDENNACGLGFTALEPWGVILRVKTRTGKSFLVKIKGT